VLDHTTGSPSLAPSEFHLFGRLKRHLLGQRFVNDDDVAAISTWLQDLDHDFFEKVLNALVPR
jgi:hypothetical protein